MNTQNNFQHIAEENIRLKQLLDRISDGFVALDAEMNYTFVNVAGGKMLGRGPKELIGTNYWKEFPEARGTPFANAYVKAFKNQETIFIEEYYEPWKRWFSNTIYPSPEGISIIFQEITDRKLSELSLKESRDNLLNFFNSSIDFHWVLDMHGNIIHINDTVKQRLGYNEEDLIGKSVFFVHPKRYREQVKHIIAKMIQGKRQNCPFPIQTKDGNEVPVETYVFEGRWDGKPAFFGVSKDISALKLSEEKFAKAFHTSPNLIGLSDINTGEYIEVNQTFYKILEYTPKEIEGQKVMDVVRLEPTFREKALTMLKEKGSVRNLETTIYTKTGKLVHVLLSADIIRINERDYNFTTGVDITELKQAEEKTRESEARYRAYVDNAPLGVFVADRNGQYLEVNDEACRITGYSRSELLCKKFTDLCDSESLESVRVHFTKVANHGRASGDIAVRTKAGEKRWWNVVGARLSDEKFLGFTEDITKRRQAEQEYIKAKEKAEESDRLKTAFINNISHEVRTPLNGILGFGDLIMEEGLSEKKKQEYYKVLRNSSKRLQDTISDIMDISQLTAGSIKPASALVHVGQLLNNLLETTQYLCAKKNILVTLQSPEQYENLVLQTDEELLSKALLHLLNNAEKFTTEGRITLGFEVTGNWLEFYVSDTGQGIAADKLDAVFEPFMQEDESVTRGHEGSGLGLTIARQVAELLGGKLWAESEKGKGSTFFFTLPFVPVESKPIQAEDIAAKPTVPGKTLVLIAEDEESSYLLMKTIVQKAGFVSLHAFNGADAVKLCHEYPEIGLILMDIKMPVMDGLEATAQIKAYRPDLPVIALTAHAQIGDRQRMLDAGCDEYMAKPVKLEALNAMIKKLIA